MLDNTKKNSYVKNQITEALIILLKEKELQDISITEITNKAEVSRISFYRNFNHKETVIKEYMFSTLNDWNKQHSKKLQHTEDDILGDIFAYITEYKEFYLLLRDRGLFYFLKDIIIATLDPKKEYPNF